jgi:hypothetical protein
MITEVQSAPLHPKTFERLQIFVSVHGFKGSGVQGCILVPGLHLWYVFTRKASASSGLIQNLKPNWQLFGEMSIFNEDFGSLMSFFVLNPERWTLNLWTVTLFVVDPSICDGFFNLKLINNDINVKIADMVKIQPQRHEGTKIVIVKPFTRYQFNIAPGACCRVLNWTKIMHNMLLDKSFANMMWFQ